MLSIGKYTRPQYVCLRFTEVAGSGRREVSLKQCERLASKIGGRRKVVGL